MKCACPGYQTADYTLIDEFSANVKQSFFVSLGNCTKNGFYFVLKFWKINVFNA